MCILVGFRRGEAGNAMDSVETGSDGEEEEEVVFGINEEISKNMIIMNR